MMEIYEQILIIVIGILVAYLIHYFYNYFTYWRRLGIRDNIWIEFSWAFKPFHEFLIDMLKANGRFFGGYNFANRILVIEDAKMARDLSIKELHNFPLRFLGHMGDSSLIHSLFFIPANEDWKRIRSIVSPAFTSGKMKGMISPINKIVNNLIKNLENFSKSGEKFDIKIYTNAFTMDVISSCAFGIDIDSISDPNHPIVTHAKRILSVDTSLSMFICFTFPKLAKLINLSPFNKESCKFFEDLTFSIVEQRLKNQTQENKQDLIGLIIEQMNHSSENGKETNENSLKKRLKGINRKEIAGQGMIFFLAGYDTTNSTLCHIIYNLVKYPEWQEKIFNELQKNEFSYESLRNLPVLNAVINETLRLFPPLLAIHRSTDRETTLLDTGYKIPAKTAIIFHPFIIHRDPKYFPDPESFKPERFLGEESAESNIAFMPFGVGPRLCIGMRFALNEIRIAISHLILNYKFLPDPNLELKYFTGNILFSPRNVIIQIQKRN